MEAIPKFYIKSDIKDISTKLTTWIGHKNTKNAFFTRFWAYVRQPHRHKSWDKPMPFASINSANPRTNPWKFWIFKLAILNFFFASSHWKMQPISMRYHFFCTMDGFSRILEKKLSELLCTRLYAFIVRECVRAGAAGSRTRRSSGHHVLNPQNFEWTRRIFDWSCSNPTK